MNSLDSGSQISIRNIKINPYQDILVSHRMSKTTLKAVTGNTHIDCIKKISQWQ